MHVCAGSDGIQRFQTKSSAVEAPGSPATFQRNEFILSGIPTSGVHCNFSYVTFITSNLFVTLLCFYQKQIYRIQETLIDHFSRHLEQMPTERRLR